MAELKSYVMGVVAMVFVGIALFAFVFPPAVVNGNYSVTNPEYQNMTNALTGLNNTVEAFNANMTKVAADTNSKTGNLDPLSGITYAISSIAPSFNLVTNLIFGAGNLFLTFPSLISPVLGGAGVIAFAQTFLFIMFSITGILIIIAAIYKWFI
jgi:hypothetical protein